MKKEKTYDRDGDYVAMAAAYYAVRAFELFGSMVFAIPNYFRERRGE